MGEEEGGKKKKRGKKMVAKRSVVISEPLDFTHTANVLLSVDD